MTGKQNKISVFQLAKVFSNDAVAEGWVIQQHWSEGIYCPECGRDRSGNKESSRGKWCHV